jgi:hypothetical protein
LLRDSRRLKDEPDGYPSSTYKTLEIQPFFHLKKEENSLQKSGLMAAEWVHARDESERAAVYSRFVRVCSKKVELMMENFMVSHLMHEEFNGLHLIRDNDL